MPDQPSGRAEVVIPEDWLIPNLNLDAVRALQGSDTVSELDRGDLLLRGVEVLVARNWIQDEAWPRIEQTIKAGYPAEKTYTFLRVHMERRSTPRPEP